MMYLGMSFHPDCDFLDGAVLERNGGEHRHALAQSPVTAWFANCNGIPRLEPLTGMRVRVGAARVRISDIVVVESPLPNEEIFTAPPYLCVEVMSPDDTMADMQDRLDDYVVFGVPNIWVIDPWKHRGWQVTAGGWATATDGMMRTC